MSDMTSTTMFSKSYVKEKLDENDRDIENLIKTCDGLGKNDIALLRGMKLHNLAISKELGLITYEEYDKRYLEWRKSMTSYWLGNKEENIK